MLKKCNWLLHLQIANLSLQYLFNNSLIWPPIIKLRESTNARLLSQCKLIVLSWSVAREWQEGRSCWLILPISIPTRIEAELINWLSNAFPQITPLPINHGIRLIGSSFNSFWSIDRKEDNKGQDNSRSGENKPLVPIQVPLNSSSHINFCRSVI